MDNARIKSEADLLILKARLRELLAPYPGWFIGGSYSYDLMCWRDLDVYVLDPRQDLRQCFDIAYEVTRRLAAVKSRFTNNCGAEPNGFYWGIKLGDISQGAWKVDLWFLDQKGYSDHTAYAERMNKILTSDSRSKILAIKEAYWQRPEFRATVTSDLIYRAVLENDIKDIHGFDAFLINATSP